MKKIFITCAMVLAIFSFMALTPAAAPAKTVKLTYSNFFPPTHIQSKLPEAWCKEVEKRTEGRVKVQYYAGQTLLKAKQTYDGVVDGIADVGEALKDHYSSAGTLGLGLPGVKRMMDEFTIDSAPGVGTRVTACKWMAR